MRVFRKAVTTSTNIDARGGVHGDVFAADRQTAGRGRLDHKWHSAEGENLTFSVVLSCGGKPPEEIATLPLVAGLAIVKALSPIVALSVKWPNDVLFDGRKVAGILCERYGDTVIAGVGLNVNQTRFPPEIASKAASLATICGRRFDREEIMMSLVDSIFAVYGRWLSGGFALRGVLRSGLSEGQEYFRSADRRRQDAGIGNLRRYRPRRFARRRRQAGICRRDTCNGDVEWIRSENTSSP